MGIKLLTFPDKVLPQWCEVQNKDSLCGQDRTH